MKLNEHVRGAQFVLLLTPNSDSWKVYRLFKKELCQRALPSQVIKSGTIRKRQSTGMILSKVVQQMNVKLGGPLWHVEAEGEERPDFEEFFEDPTMILGIHSYQTAGETWLGLVASLNKACSQYYSMADAGSSTQTLEELFRNALVAFAHQNGSQLPKKIVVYRAFLGLDDWPSAERELKVMKQVLQGAKTRPGYEPEVTFVAVAKKDDMRIFNLRPDVANITNPEPGTIVEFSTVPGHLESFYAVHHAAVRGTAVPTHYTILERPSSMTLDFIERLSYRLCLLYYSANSTVRLPAPVMYARRLTSFVATLGERPHEELSETMFYL